MDCRIVFVLLSFDVCVLEQLVRTYGFLARGMTILKGQIPQNTDVFFLFEMQVCVFDFSWQTAVPILEPQKRGVQKPPFLIIWLFWGPPETTGAAATCWRWRCTAAAQRSSSQ